MHEQHRQNAGVSDQKEKRIRNSKGHINNNMEDLKYHRTILLELYLKHLKIYMN